MRGAITGFVLVLAICLTMAAQSGRSVNDEAGMIMSLESAWNQAEVQHDPRAMSMLSADRFSYTDSEGSVMNKSQWLDLMKKETATFEQLGNSGIAVYLYADVALVSREGKTEAKFGGAFRSFYRRLDKAEWRVEMYWRPINADYSLGQAPCQPLDPSFLVE